MTEYKQAAVLIPVYREALTELERISLTQAVRVLKAYDIYFIMPESLYLKDTYGLPEERFLDQYFDSVHSYNELMLEEEFYKRFSTYEYILIHQLDAFVFSDKLGYFCDMGYDYIGALWLDGEFYYKDSGHVIWHVGNGGFSLRRVAAFLDILKDNRELLVNNRVNEDLFYAVLRCETFKTAPERTALEFGFEMKVRECYAQNGNQLPFGCHAWQKFDASFWKPWIESCGYVIPEEVCRSGRGDMEYDIKTRRKEVARFWTEKYDKEQLLPTIGKLFGGGSREYAVWGAGYWGQTLCRMIEDAGGRICGFIDGNKALECRKIGGHEVMAPQSLKNAAPKYRVIDKDEKIAECLERMDYHYREDYIFLQDIELIYKNLMIYQGNIDGSL